MGSQHGLYTQEGTVTSICGDTSVYGDVDVVVVVRRSGATVGHRPPALRRALDGPDLLVVDDLADAELAGVGAGPVGDVPAHRGVGDHHVDGLPGAVEPTAGPAATERADLRVAG